jgi:hypothetical protein
MVAIKSRLTSMFCLFLVAACHQQSNVAPKGILPNVTSALSDTIHFEELTGKHWIVINTIFQDSIPAKLIVDNGTKWVIYLDQAFAIQKRLISDSTEEKKYQEQRLPFRINHIRDTAVNTIIFDLKGIVGKVPDGLLGHDFLAKYIVEINYKKRYLFLHNGASFQPPNGFLSIPMRKNSPKDTKRKIQLSFFLKGGKRIQDEAVLDLGQGSNELFFAGGATRKHDLLQFVKGQEPKVLGRYVTSEENFGYEIQTDSIHLGGVSIKNVRASLSTSTTGISGADMISFGNGLLRNFGVVFLDLSNNKLFLPSCQMQ